ncbi:MAG: hypothetical protein KFF50_11690, partial [Desulfatitalea sp.]|nr:hypothetical protein [Desulfatitalea sp.]
YTDDFEKMGFFFAGILPDTSIGDAMILQNLSNIDIDYSAIKILPGETKVLLDYIRKCDPNLQQELPSEDSRVTTIGQTPSSDDFFINAPALSKSAS